MTAARSTRIPTESEVAQADQRMLAIDANIVAKAQAGMRVAPQQRLHGTHEISLDVTDIWGAPVLQDQLNGWVSAPLEDIVARRLDPIGSELPHFDRLTAEQQYIVIKIVGLDSESKLSVHEIARNLGYSPGQVRSRYAKAEEVLRHAYGHPLDVAVAA